ncbi:helicase associated domain-containing protein [Sulfitobacter sp. JL08]
MHGDCNVPYGWPENEKLASWVTTQRTNAVKGNLTDERRQRLKAIGFRF